MTVVLIATAFQAPLVIKAEAGQYAEAAIPWEVDIVFNAPPSDPVAWAAANNATLLFFNATKKLAIVTAEDYVSLLRAVRGNASVARAEIPGVFRTGANDPCYPERELNEPNLLCPAVGGVGQWNLHKIDTDSAWAYGLGSDSVVIAILDTGVTFQTQADLDGNVWSNADEQLNGKDDDGNGYCDDLHGANTFLVLGLSPLCQGTGFVADDWGHGTHVAGIASAEINNGLGIAGVSNGTFMPVKAWQCPCLPGAQLGEGLAEGIRYADQEGARIISMSVGKTNAFGNVEAKVNEAWANGRLLVAAAGNTPPPNCGVWFPAMLENVIAVSATTKEDELAPYSCSGVEVDLSAPGAYNSLCEVSPLCVYSTKSPTGWEFRQGTSQAAPHVAGVAALVWAQRPGLTNAQVRDILFNSADDLGNPGKDSSFGHGRLNAGRALSLVAGGIHPVAAFGISPPIGRTDTVFEGNASSSFDLDTTNSSGLNFTWDWGDGSSSFGLLSSHQYAAANTSGGYLVKLRVRDAQGNTANITERVKVAKAPAPGPCSAAPGFPIDLKVAGPRFPGEDLTAPLVVVNGTRQVEASVYPPSCGHEIRFHIETWTTSTACRLKCLALESSNATSWKLAGERVTEVINLTFQAPGLKVLSVAAEARLQNGSQVNRSSPSAFELTVLPKLQDAQGKLDLPRISSLLELHGLPPPSLVTTSTNDTWHARQWGNRMLRAPESRAVANGSAEVVVAIVDSGVDRNHEDLNDNMWSNGTTVGADFSASEILPGPDPRDDLGHGTHLAGIVSAVATNGKGITGLAAGVKVMPVKVGLSNTTAGRLAAGIRWAVNQSANIVLVAATSGQDLAEVREAVDYAESRGVVVIAAGGNQASNASRFPAAYETVVAVSGVNSAQVNTTFSNRGSWIDAAAPSVGIISTWPALAVLDNTPGEFTFEGARGNETWGLEEESLNTSLLENLGKRYGNMTGTSVAAAYVAAVAALVKSANSSLSGERLRHVLFASTIDLGTNGTDTTYGAGRVDAMRAVVYAKSLPKAQFNVAPSTGSTTTTFVANGANSTDVLDGPLNYTWQWGDGSPQAFGVESSHQYASPGTYTVHLTVRNAFSLNDTQARSVTVS